MSQFCTLASDRENIDFSTEVCYFNIHKLWFGRECTYAWKKIQTVRMQIQHIGLFHVVL